MHFPFFKHRLTHQVIDENNFAKIPNNVKHQWDRTDEEPTHEVKEDDNADDGISLALIGFTSDPTSLTSELMNDSETDLSNVTQSTTTDDSDFQGFGGGDGGGGGAGDSWSDSSSSDSSSFDSSSSND